MAGFEHIYADPDGEKIRIRESSDYPPGAYLEPCISGVQIPAHRLAEFCGYLYQAAGQPVPDLPQIFDPSEVYELAKALRYAHTGTSGPMKPIDEPLMQTARVLLAHGWRRTP